MPRFLVRNPNFYDVDAEEERQKQALLKYINAIREQRPGMRPTLGQAALFFAKCVMVLVGLAGIAFLAWLGIVGVFSL